MEGKAAPSQVPSSLIWEGNIVADNKCMVDLFNQHFVQISNSPIAVTPHDPALNRSPLSTPDRVPAHRFSLQDVSVSSTLRNHLDQMAWTTFFLKLQLPLLQNPLPSFATYLYTRLNYHLPGRQPQYAPYLKGEIKLTPTAIVLSLFYHA